ncbi:MAG: hypothetical protein JRN08_07500 [Nitrososphaerota archaeon]|nr:hypothetical protein [Nitrososphaerota archaeon]
MTNVTFALPERTVRRLRRRVAERGGRKGAISELVDQALTVYLDGLDDLSRGEVFYAKRGETLVAEAASLEELVEALKARKVDWRTVLITSSAPLGPAGRLGFRVRPA